MSMDARIADDLALVGRILDRNQPRNDWRLRAVVENDSNRYLTIDHENAMPRPGESELARQVRVYGIDFALDVLAEGADIDGIVSTITIEGRTAHIDGLDDALFVNGKDRIVKTFSSAKLSATRIAWAKQGRTITNVTIGARIA